MDDATRLVSELHEKLAELDSKVSAYQRDMLAEFHKHLEDCLKKYPDHVSNEVSRAIAESMSMGRYSALRPATQDAPESPAINHHAWDRRKSPPPILPHTSGIPKEGPRSPHAREQEFHGLFTPTYLPLLDSREHYRSPPISPSPSAGATSSPLSVDNMTKADEAKHSASAGHKGRPDSIRRLTDRSTSSVESSGSDSKVRRSALRRSSSSNKGSPRRVRFDFEGEEVFPSASSPKASPTLTPASGAEPQPKAETSATAIAIENESTEYVGTSLLDVEGEEDWLPKPKKVSSTQALQALTRSPLEEGTVWTVVNPDPEEPVKMNGEKQPENVRESSSLKVDSSATLRSGDSLDEEPPRTEVLGSPIEELGNYDDDEDGDASDVEFLAIKPKRKTPSPAAANPFARPPAQASTATSTVNGKAAADDDLDPFFDFEEGGSKSQEKYLPEPEDDDSDHEVGISTNRLRSLVSPAPALEDQDDEPQEENKFSDNRSSSTPKPPPVSPSAALFGHSVGSYMGRSITVDPITNPKLYDEIAGMKDVRFWVGSVMEGPADLGSYRAGNVATRGLVAAGATPRSFSERLALEEEMERRGVGRGAREEGEE